MKQITKTDYYKIHPDFRGIWSRDDGECAKWIGRRTAMSGSLGLELGFLAIEGENFEIVE